MELGWNMLVCFEKDSQCKAVSNHYHLKSILWFSRRILNARGLVCLLDRLWHACVPTFIFSNFGKLFGTNTHYSNWCGKMLNLRMNHALVVDADQFILCKFWSCFKTIANHLYHTLQQRSNDAHTLVCLVTRILCTQVLRAYLNLEQDSQYKFPDEKLSSYGIVLINIICYQF